MKALTLRAVDEADQRHIAIGGLTKRDGNYARVALAFDGHVIASAVLEYQFGYWHLAEVAPTCERCPWCWGTGTDPAYPVPDDDHFYAPPCLVCRGDGGRDPIPARGRQRLWNWEPS